MSHDFHHPFEPYDIQQQLMQAVYDCIEDGQVGIFESPTGTGKSLSLICASLTWLREHKRKAFDASLDRDAGMEDEPSWMIEHARKTRLQEALRLRAEFEARLDAIRQREAQMRESADRSGLVRKKARIEATPAQSIAEDAFLLDDYNSDSDHPAAKPLYSADTEKLLAELGMIQEKTDTRASEDTEESIKVFICSRTHSQLSQFVGELRRVKLPASLPPTSTGDDEDVESLKQLCLGSRKNLCINPDVRSLPSLTAMNERCLDLQSAGKDKPRCAFALKHDKPEQALDFRDHALAQVRDIEDLAAVGQKLKTCPYYASRSALGPAEVVLLPYPLLLQRASRETLGISLKGSVVIIDEAHNLTDAVESTHSCQISQRRLQHARECLMTYLHKFRMRLKGSNRTYLAQVVRVVDSLLAAMQSLTGTSGLIKPEALLAGKNADQINLPKLARYITESKLARKVEGYAQFAKNAAGTEQAPETPTLTLVQRFVQTLANPSAEGRFFWDRTDRDVVLRYILLDPSQHFRDIVEDARAVILAGGTMSPMEDHINQLLPYVKDVKTLSCGHIVPASHILVRTISIDNQGAFDFTYRTRNDKLLAKRLGQQLLNIAEVVSGGMVIFFASYAYLDFVLDCWKADGSLEALKAVGPTFFDGRLRPAEGVFREYADAVTSSSKAILFSVIGGKLSEGINFSDELGRCVVVVGMPYPNLETPEWKAKLAHIQSRHVGTATGGRDVTNQEFAENICMRAVNQAVGRAIRHKGDWAAILLVDQRYARPRIRVKLPGWIRGSLPSDTSFDAGRLESDLANFFNARRNV